MCCPGGYLLPTDLASPAGLRSEPFRIKGWHVAAMVVAFFAVVTSVNAFMMVEALRTMPGVVVKSSYDASQKYNGDIAEARDIAALGYAADADIKGSSASLVLRDGAGRGISGLAVSLFLQHPADKTRDVTATLEDAGEGRYVATLAIEMVAGPR